MSQFLRDFLPTFKCISSWPLHFTFPKPIAGYISDFFPRGVLDEILNLIESVSEGFPAYSCIDISLGQVLDMKLFLTNLASVSVLSCVKDKF